MKFSATLSLPRIIFTRFAIGTSLLLFSFFPTSLNAQDLPAVQQPDQVLKSAYGNVSLNPHLPAYINADQHVITTTVTLKNPYSYSLPNLILWSRLQELQQSTSISPLITVNGNAVNTGATAITLTSTPYSHSISLNGGEEQSIDLRIPYSPNLTPGNFTIELDLYSQQGFIVGSQSFSLDKQLSGTDSFLTTNISKVVDSSGSEMSGPLTLQSGKTATVTSTVKNTHPSAITATPTAQYYQPNTATPIHTWQGHAITVAPNSQQEISYPLGDVNINNPGAYTVLFGLTDPSGALPYSAQQVQEFAIAGNSPTILAQSPEVNNNVLTGIKVSGAIYSTNSADGTIPTIQKIRNSLYWQGSTKPFTTQENTFTGSKNKIVYQQDLSLRWRLPYFGHHTATLRTELLDSKGKIISSQDTVLIIPAPTVSHLVLIITGICLLVLLAGLILYRKRRRSGSYKTILAVLLPLGFLFPFIAPSIPVSNACTASTTSNGYVTTCHDPTDANDPYNNTNFFNFVKSNVGVGYSAQTKVGSSSRQANYSSYLGNEDSGIAITSMIITPGWNNAGWKIPGGYASYNYPIALTGVPDGIYQNDAWVSYFFPIPTFSVTGDLVPCNTSTAFNAAGGINGIATGAPAGAKIVTDAYSSDPSSWAIAYDKYGDMIVWAVACVGTHTNGSDGTVGKANIQLGFDIKAYDSQGVNKDMDANAYARELLYEWANKSGGILAPGDITDSRYYQLAPPNGSYTNGSNNDLHSFNIPFWIDTSPINVQTTWIDQNHVTGDGWHDDEWTNTLATCQQFSFYKNSSSFSTPSNGILTPDQGTDTPTANRSIASSMNYNNTNCTGVTVVGPSIPGGPGTPYPGPAPTIALTANPSVVDKNAASNLAWTTANADYVLISGYGFNGTTHYPSQGNTNTPGLPTSQTFTVTPCRADGNYCVNPAQATVKIRGSAPVLTVNGSAVNNQIANYGQVVNVHIHSDFADSSSMYWTTPHTPTGQPWNSGGADWGQNTSGLWETITFYGYACNTADFGSDPAGCSSATPITVRVLPQVPTISTDTDTVSYGGNTGLHINTQNANFAAFQQFTRSVGIGNWQGNPVGNWTSDGTGVGYVQADGPQSYTETTWYRAVACNIRDFPNDGSGCVYTNTIWVRSRAQAPTFSRSTDRVDYGGTANVAAVAKAATEMYYYTATRSSNKVFGYNNWSIGGGNLNVANNSMTFNHATDPLNETTWFQAKACNGWDFPNDYENGCAYSANTTDNGTGDSNVIAVRAATPSVWISPTDTPTASFNTSVDYNGTNHVYMSTPYGSAMALYYRTRSNNFTLTYANLYTDNPTPTALAKDTPTAPYTESDWYNVNACNALDFPDGSGCVLSGTVGVRVGAAPPNLTFGQSWTTYGGSDNFNLTSTYSSRLQYAKATRTGQKVYAWIPGATVSATGANGGPSTSMSLPRTENGLTETAWYFGQACNLIDFSSESEAHACSYSDTSVNDAPRDGSGNITARPANMIAVQAAQPIIWFNTGADNPANPVLATVSPKGSAQLGLYSAYASTDSIGYTNRTLNYTWLAHTGTTWGTTSFNPAILNTAYATDPADETSWYYGWACNSRDFRDSTGCTITGAPGNTDPYQGNIQMRVRGGATAFSGPSSVPYNTAINLTMAFSKSSTAYTLYHSDTRSTQQTSSSGSVPVSDTNQGQLKYTTTYQLQACNTIAGDFVKDPVSGYMPPPDPGKDANGQSLNGCTTNTMTGLNDVRVIVAPYLNYVVSQSNVYTLGSSVPVTWTTDNATKLTLFGDGDSGTDPKDPGFASFTQGSSALKSGSSSAVYSGTGSFTARACNSDTTDSNGNPSNCTTAVGTVSGNSTQATDTLFCTDH